MLTAEEKKERDELHRLQMRILGPYPQSTRDKLARLIELERKDAADPTPIVDCCNRRATECDCSAEKRTEVWRAWFRKVNPDSLLPDERAADFDDEPTKERKR